MKGKISEIFFSVQGEGIFLGTPCWFVRFYGCRRRCRYCDTQYAARGGKYTEKTASAAAAELTGNFPVVITGGEPLQQARFLKELVSELHGRKLFLETAGGSLIKKIAEKFSRVSFHFRPPLEAGDRRFVKSISAVPFSLKIVVIKGLKYDEVEKAALFVKNYKNADIILQPESGRGGVKAASVRKAVSFARRLFPLYEAVRVIPQTHRILGVK